MLLCRLNHTLVILFAAIGLCFNALSSILAPLQSLTGLIPATENQPEQGEVSTFLHEKKPRPIYGRFLHITDIHPDPFYKANTSSDETCHRDVDEDGQTGIYGRPLSPCDSPTSLVDATFDWIDKNLKDNIDFVIWTGDNVRHDRDNRFPRTEMHIFDMNEKMVSKFEDLFGCDDLLHPLTIPVVPSIGNNDVYPHNLFAQGPTLQTREFYKLWRKMVPEEQFHVFDRGLSFMVEVIPGKLAVLSLNTLYWFQSNPIVDGCDRRKDPGHLQFRWLSIVLAELRARNMKVWLSGHVPPNSKNFEPSCLDRLSAWIHEYRDIIVGGLYGHMNVDHFLFLDSEATTERLTAAEKVRWTSQDDSPVSTFGKVEYLQDVRMSYDALEDDLDGSFNTRYSVAHVSPSIIPTYLPGLRVWEYNTTGINDQPATVYANGQPFRSWADVFEEVEQELQRLLEADDYPEDEDEITDDELKAEKKKDSKNQKKKADPTWPPKSENIAPGPAYVPQTFSPTRYIQYFANLTAANIGDKDITFELEYTTDEKPYNMPNLLVSSWVQLARRLAAEISSKSSSIVDGPQAAIKKAKYKKSRQLWRTYLRNAFVSSGYEDIDD